jgi:FAD:protein FMN transferase
MATAPRGPRHVEHVMGTAVSIDIRDPSVGPETVTTVTGWLHMVDATFSTYRYDSAISQVARGERAPSDCPQTVRWVLDRCAALTHLTGGYFDVRHSGRLDPSGLVKGWAIDQAHHILCAAGSRSHCLNGGGDIRTHGLPTPGRPWRIGIVDPHDPGRLAAVVAAGALAVATSGSAERGPHVVNPLTGTPARDLVSVTVVGPNLADADAYATTAMAMGGDALAWLAALDSFEAFTVAATGDRWWTDGWGQYGY